MAEVTTGTPGGAATKPHDVFVAHAAADAEWVHGFLLPALGIPDGRVVTREDFRPGAAEVAQFGESVTSSRITVVVLTPAFLHDAWSVFAEQLASHAGVDADDATVVPIVLQPCDVPLHVAFRVRLDCTDPSRWDAEVVRLRELVETPEPPPEQVPCPYPGMRPFAASDAALFYGREDEVADLVRRLRHLGFLAVIGPSGSGKSSLVLAGLLPELAHRHGAEMVTRSMRPGADPVAALDEALGSDGTTSPTAAAAALAAATPPATRLLLVVDQLEESFTLAPAPARTAFFRALGELRRAPDVTVILTMRADFFGELMASSLWPIDPSERCEVPPLRGAALGRAIVEPAAAVGVRIEPALVERVVADAADEPGVLPLVQETLVQLWELRQRRLLTLESYEDLGRDGASGLAVALATTADGAIAALPEAQHDMARRIFLGLVQLGEGRHDTRRQQPVTTLRSGIDDPEQFDRTLAHLVGRRLLTVTGDEASVRRVDLAHEALIAGWPRLERWIEESRERLRLQREVAGDAAAWVEVGRDPGALYRGARLAAAARWADANPAEPTALELEFVDAGRAAEAGEAEAVRLRAEGDVRASKRKRRTYAGLVVAVALTVLVGTMAWRSSRDARDQKDLARSRQLASHAFTELLTRPDRGLLLALQALATEPSAEAKDALLYGLGEPPVLTYLQTDGPVVDAVAVDPTGRLFATGDRMRQVTLWDVEERRPTRLGEHDDVVNAVAFSPDGALVASAGNDGAVRLWDVGTRRPRGEPLPRSGAGPASSVAFGADGRFVAAGTAAGVDVWDVASGRPVADAFGGSRPAVAFSPDGRLLAAAGADGVLLWDVRSRASVGAPIESGTPFQAVAFSTDGTTLAAASDHRIELFDVADRVSTGDVLEGSNAVRSLAFGNGGYLAAAYEEGPIVVWDPDTGDEFELAMGGPNEARSLAFAAEGATLLSGGSALIVWDVDRNQVLTRQIAPGDEEGAGFLSGASRLALTPDGRRVAAVRHEQPAVVVDADGEGEPVALAAEAGAAVAFERDGRTVVVLEQDGTLSRWAADTGQRRPGTGNVGPAQGLAELAPGARFAAVAADGGAEVWDVAAGRPVARPTGDDDPAGAAFSPDARRVAVATADHVVVWDLAERKPVGAPLDLRPPPGPATSDIPPSTGTAASTPRADLSFSADGDRLAAVTGNGEVFLFDLASGAREHVASRAVVEGIALSPDGRLLVWNARDGLAAWDVVAHQRIGGGTDEYSALHVGPFDATGSLVLVGDEFGGVYTVHTTVAKWRALACSVVNRNLSKAEWERFVGAGVAYRRTCAEHPSGPGAPKDAPAARYAS